MDDYAILIALQHHGPSELLIMNDLLAAGSHAFAPLYKEVRNLLTQALAQGEWKPGEVLPSESKLAQRFRVSIGTIRHAIDELVAEQILLRHQGRGTFVATHSRRRMLYRFFRLVGEDGVKGSPEVEMVSFDRDRASEEEARRLNLLPGERVFRIVNMQRLDGRPVAVDHMVLSNARFPDLTEKILREREDTNYSLYQTRYGINVVRAHERLRAAVCDRDTAKLLGLKLGAPVLEINRTAMSYHNTPVELRRSLVNTAAHEYWNDIGKPDSQTPGIEVPAGVTRTGLPS
jgi:GntR family transcriptional regulator